MGHRVVCSRNIGGENCIDLKIDFLNLYTTLFSTTDFWKLDLFILDVYR